MPVRKRRHAPTLRAEAAGWQGAFVAKGTPSGIVERLHAAIAREQAHPDYREALAHANIPSAEGVSRQAFARMIAADLATWRQIVVDGNIKPE